MIAAYEKLSHSSINFEAVEISDLNFFRDLGPVSRSINKKDELPPKELRKIQKKILS